MTHRITRRGALVAAAAAVLVALPLAASAELIDRIVAQVNDRIITKYEVEKETTPYLLRNGMQPTVLQDPERREEIHADVLETMIDRHLILEEARKMDLSVNDQQVDRWLAFTRSKQNMSEQQFRQMIQRYGMSYEAYRETVRQNLLKVRFVRVKLGRKVSIPDSEVEKRYEERYGPIGATEKHRTVRHILFRPDSEKPAARRAAKRRASKVLSKLEEGTEFQKLAKKHSDGPSAEKGGLLGTFSRGELNPAFQDVVIQLGAGEHSGVVETKYGFHILRVDKVTEKESTNVQKRKKKIRQRLREKKMQTQLDSYVESLRDKAFIDVKI